MPSSRGKFGSSTSAGMLWCKVLVRDGGTDYCEEGIDTGRRYRDRTECSFRVVVESDSISWLSTQV